MNRPTIVAAIAAATTIALATPASAAALPVPSEARVTTAEVQLRLNALGVEKPLAVDGIYGPKTDGALEARLGRQVSGVDAAALDLLRRETRGGWSVVVDKSDRRTTVLRHGIPVATTLSGTGGGYSYVTKQGKTARAVTPEGNFRVQREIEGWRISSSVDGALYEPHYLVGGIAIHGSTQPGGTSHGCIRVSLVFAGALDTVLGKGSPVRVQA